MVRRSTVDYISPPDVHEAGYDAGASDPVRRDGEARRPATSWRGAGGRWLVWVLRVVVWAALLIIGYRGVTAIVLNETPAGSPPPPPRATTAAFPARLAGAFALQFGEVYLNASPATAAARASELAQFLPAGGDPQLGWNQVGTLQLQSEDVAGVHARSAHRGVVTLLARVNGKLMELGVPIYAEAGRMVVSGEPALLPPPARATVPQTLPVNSDAAAQTALSAQLADFFRAYASGNADTLARFVAPGGQVTGLGGDVTFASLSNVVVPQGGGTRDIVATVVWRIPGQPAGGRKATAGSQAAEFEMSYALTVTKRSGTWYVKDIGPASQAVGSP